jgi:uncharacterized membrane protein YraQ (UPF0718 family)
MPLLVNNGVPQCSRCLRQRMLTPAIGEQPAVRIRIIERGLVRRWAPMGFLYTMVGLGVAISIFGSRENTLRALTIAAKRFLGILPAFSMMLILVSVVLSFLPDEVIVAYLGTDNLFAGTFFASLLGSITLMPGFIAFPLSGILLAKGVPYMVLSAFTTTLMMVGVLSYPVERAHFGATVTVIRNLISVLIALAVAAATGLCFGELT